MVNCEINESFVILSLESLLLYLGRMFFLKWQIFFRKLDRGISSKGRGDEDPIKG